MGSYGIGVERIMAAAIELHHDADGIDLAADDRAVPRRPCSPWARNRSSREPRSEVCTSLAKLDIDVLYDDRDERAGVKFKDADLIGVPIRLAIGKRGLADGKLEWKLRSKRDVEMVLLGDAAARAAALVNG